MGCWALVAACTDAALLVKKRLAEPMTPDYFYPAQPSALLHPFPHTLGGGPVGTHAPRSVEGMADASVLDIFGDFIIDAKNDATDRVKAMAGRVMRPDQVLDEQTQLP